jgi:FAD-linked oxidoreductase
VSGSHDRKDVTTTTWRNWARNQSADPARVQTPTSLEAAVEVIARARAEGLRVKAVGSGHSFTDVAVTDGMQVRLDGFDGIISCDAASGLVTVGAGTPLHRLNPALEARGLSMSNLGDIDRQTISGAISTGTHGTGARLGGLATQVRGLHVVLADGSVVECSDTVDPDLYAAARVGLGAFGLITAVTLQCEPLFRLTAVEAPMPLEEVLEDFDVLADGNDHFEFYWFPHTDVALTKRNNRVAAGVLGPADPAPPSYPSWRSWVDDELLANGAFGVLQRFTTLVPAAIPEVNSLAARSLSARTFTDVSHRVFVSPRRVRFREMEYAVPRESVTEVVRGIRGWIESSGARISFPIEVRVAAADDVWLSTAYGRETGYVAVHSYYRTPYQPYFDAVEAIATGVGGRPHWGKLHHLDAGRLRGRYPRFDDALAVRDAVDPGRVFANAYTARVLGP